MTLSKGTRWVEYNVALPPIEVRSRLSNSIEQERYLFSTDKEPFMGKVSESSFRIYIWSKYRNSWRPILRGRIEPFGDGTRITAKVGVHPFVRLFSLFLFGSMAYNVFKSLSGHAQSSEKQMHDIQWTLGFLAFMVFMEIFGRWGGRATEDKLLALLDSLFLDPGANQPGKVG